MIGLGLPLPKWLSNQNFSPEAEEHQVRYPSSSPAGGPGTSLGAAKHSEVLEGVSHHLLV